MQQLFIADLHLSPNHPRLVRGFLDLLQHYKGKVDQLYILGDWFEAWIGDDNHSTWLDEIVAALQQFSASGSQIFFMHGNRDFALGQQFMQRFGGKLISDERISIQTSIQNVDLTHTDLIDSHSTNAHLNIVLEHGDALCTDDIAYQRFKKIIRNPLVLNTLLYLPLSWRQRVANKARQQSKRNYLKNHLKSHLKSQQNKNIKSNQQNKSSQQDNISNQSENYQQSKPHYIIDVNQQAVDAALLNHDVLIHGHTHRPAIHEYANGKKRIVLGDWREDISRQSVDNINNSNEKNNWCGIAEIVLVDSQHGVQFIDWRF